MGAWKTRQQFREYRIFSSFFAFVDVFHKFDRNCPICSLKVDPESFAEVNDIVRGKMNVGGCRDGDPIIVDFDGLPTGYFSSVVDDHLMLITHVLRGVEHLPATPQDLALYK